jgi:uncharacterized membrane protein
MSKASRITAAVAAATIVLLTAIAADAGAQSIIPVVEVTVEPLTQEVDASSGAASAVYNCSVNVSGLPLVRYRVNLTADCEGWPAACDPAQFVVSGNGTNSFHATVNIPAGEPGGQMKYLTINASVSTTGLQIATCTTYAILNTRQSFGLKLASGTAALSVTAGKPVTWAFSLKNNGNGRDTYSLSVIDLQTYTHSNWTLKFNRTFVSADPGDTGDCAINITPDHNTTNQTVTFRIKAFSRGASYQNITVEDTLELQLTVAAAPGGGGGGKKTTTPKATPGMEAPWLLLAAILAALACMLRRS